MSYSSEVLTDGPLAYYRLNESSGTSFADSSGNGRTGAFVNSPTLGQGGAIADGDLAVLFNGSNQRADVTGDAGMNVSTVTMEAWVKTTATSGTILSKGSVPAVCRIGLTSGKAFIEINTGAATLLPGVTAVNDGAWHHIVGTWDGSTSKVYVDGVLDASGSKGGTLATSSGGLHIANRSADSYLAATIDEVAYYGSALSSTRVAAHYSAGLTVSQTVALGKATRSTTVRPLAKSVGIVRALGKVTRASTVHPVDVISGQTRTLGKVTRTASLRSLTPAVDSVTPLGKVTRGTTLYPVSDAATSTVALGKVARESDVYPLFPSFSYATPRMVRAGGRRRTGLGQGFWEPAVTTPPATVAYGDERVIAHAFTTPVMDGLQPRFDVTSADEPQHRDRILVGGVDITYFRDALTPTPTYQLVEPLLYGPATLSLPQVAACFEEPGTGALSWLRPGKKVKVQRVDRATNTVVATDYVGVVIAFDTDGNELTVQIGGEASGRAALRYVPLPLFRSTHDIGKMVYHAVHSLGLRFSPRFPETGIELARFGGTGHLDYISQLLARAQDRDGNQWTVTKNGTAYELVQKDRTTIHGTVYLDDARAVASLRRDISEEPNRIYADGTTPDGERVANAVFPGVQQGPPAPYPFRDHRSFGLGTSNADTDTGDGITVMLFHLQVTKYLGTEDSPGGYDRDVVRAVKALQDDAGLPETGVMDVATWNALYDVGTTGASLRWSQILPMAQKGYTRPWKRAGSGAIMGRNPNYDPSRLVVDRPIDFGSGFTKKQMREWSRNEIDQSEDNWVGDITLHSGAVVAGDHTPGDPIVSLLRARDIKPGMNLSLPLFAGGIVVHVSAASVGTDGLVTLSVDTRARDALEVWEVIARNRETRRDPARQWEQQYRASGQLKDVIDGWTGAPFGIVGTKTPLNGGEWNIVEVVAGQVGTMMRLELDTNPNAEFAVAVFGAKVSAATLNHRIGNPLTATGKDKWSDETVRAVLDRDHLLLYAAGDDGSPCGYWPKQKQGDHPLTGKFRDDAQFSYATQRYPVLYVAIYPDRNTAIPAGRVMWPQLEAGA